jgi:hypothetical protein
MEYLTIKLDCTENRCGNCEFWRKEFDGGLGDDFCMIFNKALNYDYGERVRLSECITACKK